MIDVRFAASEDLALVDELAALVNRVYDVAEAGLWVADPDYRGHGVGGALIAFAERWAVREGRDTMQLEVLVPVDAPEQGVPHGLVRPSRISVGTRRAARGSVPRTRAVSGDDM